MAKKPKPERSQLAKALDMLSLTYKAGEEQAMYAMFHNGQACSFNSIVAVGTNVEEDLTICPHIGLLEAAIEKCGAQPYTIAQISRDKLLVRSEDFQAYIPCFDPALLLWPQPDALVAAIDDRLQDALKKVAGIASLKAETVIEASIQLNSGNCIATNRSVIVEAWHGLDLPDGLLLPKLAVSVLTKAKKKLTGFGSSPRTATFYFEDGSWMRTQLYDDHWPPVEQHLNHHCNPRTVPPMLFSAASDVAVFSADGYVYVKDGLVSSHSFDKVEEGSSLKLPIGSEHGERAYAVKNLSLIHKLVQQWDENYQDNGTMFIGESVRGVINHIKASPPLDEDIPF